MNFSIIVPVYKVEDCLEECIDSLIMQNYDDYEIILVDDGSPDCCPQICAKYAELEAKVRVIHKENGGLSSARNAGLDIATGDYIIFVDSDDVIAPGSLCDLAKVCEGGADIILSQYYGVTDVHAAVLQDTVFKHPESTDKGSVINYIFSGKAKWASVQYVIKRTMIEEFDLRFDEGYYHEDVCWTTKIFTVAKSFEFYNNVWYIRREGRCGSITNTINSKRTFDMFDMVDAAMSFINMSDMNKKTKKIISNQLARADYSSLKHYGDYSSIDKKKVCELVNKKREIFKNAKPLKYKIFHCLLLVFGARFTLRLATSIK